VRRGAFSAESLLTLHPKRERLRTCHLRGLLERKRVTERRIPMAGVIADLKDRARILHRQIDAGDPDALRRVRQLDDFRGLAADASRERVRRRHCLAAIATELGFDGWPHAVAVLSGKESRDFGTLLYPRGADAHWNIWSASYEEAKAIREQHGGYLLAYRRHYFIADRHFITTIGLNPDDPDWQLIGRDWVKPRRVEARERLYGELIRRRQPLTGPLHQRSR